VPFLRNPGFVGREEDLAQVHALLQNGEAVGVRPVAAAGMGGIGKTQLAVEYAYRHARDVQAEMAALAEKVGLFEDDAPEAERQRRRVLAFVRFLGEQPEALVIFDNVEDPVAEGLGLPEAEAGLRTTWPPVPAGLQEGESLVLGGELDGRCDLSNGGHRAA
jgi:hypothetical protein